MVILVAIVDFVAGLGHLLDRPDRSRFDPSKVKIEIQMPEMPPLNFK